MHQFYSGLLILILLSCSSQKRTPYQKFKEKKGGGYNEIIFDSDLKSISFKGNSHTKKSYAELFSKFRTIENCRSENKLSQMLSVSDQSKSKTVTRSTSDVYGFPSYYGYHPYRYSGIGFSAGFNTIRSDSWDETLIYPQIEVYYRCVEKVYEPEIILREVPASEMNALVKDLKGALQIENILEGSPNLKVLKVGDIILKASGSRIQKNHELLKIFSTNQKHETLEIMREGQRMPIKIMATDVTSQVKSSEEAIILAACKFDDVRKKSPLCPRDLK